MCEEEPARWLGWRRKRDREMAEDGAGLGAGLGRQVKGQRDSDISGLNRWKVGE